MAATASLPTDFAITNEHLVLRPFSNTIEERQALTPLLGDAAVRRWRWHREGQRVLPISLIWSAAPRLGGKTMSTTTDPLGHHS